MSAIPGTKHNNLAALVLDMIKAESEMASASGSIELQNGEKFEFEVEISLISVTKDGQKFEFLTRQGDYEDATVQK